MCLTRDKKYAQGTKAYNGFYYCNDDMLAIERRDDFNGLKMFFDGSIQGPEKSIYKFMMYCGEFIKKYGGSALVQAIDAIAPAENRASEMVDITDQGLWK